MGGQNRAREPRPISPYPAANFQSAIPLLGFAQYKAGVDFCIPQEYSGGMIAEVKVRDWERVDPVLGAGVYALLWYEEVVYVGKAKRVLHRLYQHRCHYERARQGRRLPANAKAIRFNAVGVISCKEVDLDWIERAMIEKYRPKYNVRMVPQGKVSLERAGFDFTPLLNIAAAPRAARRM